MNVDTGGTFSYNTELERIIQTAIEKAFVRIVPALSNLDNKTALCNQPLVNKPTLTIAEAAQYIGISKPNMYKLAKKQDFPTIHVGRKILISRDALLRWMEKGNQHGEEEN